MKRYFILKNEKLIEQQKEYENMKKKINDVFMEFVKEHGIETSKYYQFTSQLRIVPTENDIQKFRNQLKVDNETFKKNSAINKEWMELCKANGLETPRQPLWELSDLIPGCIYRFRSSLFSLNDEVYGTFEQDQDFNLPEKDFKELKASEFYKIIEEYEGE